MRACFSLCFFFLILQAQSLSHESNNFLIENLSHDLPIIENEIKDCEYLSYKQVKGKELLRLKKNDQCLTIRSIAFYSSLIRDPTPSNLRTYISFRKYHESWPLASIMKKNSEKYITKGELNDEILNFLCKKKPQTMNTILSCQEYLDREVGKEESRTFLKKSFTESSFSEKQGNLFLLNFGFSLSQEDYFNRACRLIIMENFKEILSIIPFLKGNDSFYIKVRLFLKKRNKNAEKFLTPYKLRINSDAGLALDYVTWLRCNKSENISNVFINPSSFVRFYPSSLWRERLEVIKKAIIEKNPRKAYLLGKNHGLTYDDKERYFEAEWILGWISLNYLDNPKQAIKHFSHIKRFAAKPNLLVKTQYWLARSYEKLLDEKEFRSLYRRASKYRTTYYGQLSMGKVSPFSSEKIKLPRIKISKRTFLELENRMFVRVLYALYSSESNLEATRFACSLMRSRIPFDHERTLFLIIKSALKYCCLESEQISTYLKDIPHRMSYPILDHLEKSSLLCKDLALVHAVIRQESLFREEVRSKVGAYGLMQVMPKTSESVSRRINFLKNEESSSSKISSIKFNLKIGSYYLQDQLNIYNDDRRISLAAYNAGPSSVNRWIKSFGDPRSNFDPIGWTEMIPFRETRDYVMKTLSNYIVYRSILSQDVTNNFSYKY